MKALIIEKNRDIVSMLDEIGASFSYFEAHSLAEARVQIDAGGYPLIVLDCGLPEPDCLSLVKHIRRNDFPGSVYLGDSSGYVYVVIIGCPDDGDAFLAAGADDVVRGPVRAQELKKSMNIAHRVLTLNHCLSRAYDQMAKLDQAAAIGRLLPGIAHEINNPLGFVDGNLSVLGDYCRRLCEEIRPGGAAVSNSNPAVKPFGTAPDLETVLSDIFPLLDESRQGLERMKTLVRDIQQVTHHDGDHPVEININECLDAALNVLWNELKYKAVVSKSYARLAPLRAYSGQIHQVFLNLLLHAAGSIQDKGEIRLTTVNGNGRIEVTIAGSGSSAGRRESSSGDEASCAADGRRRNAGIELQAAQSIIQRHNGILETKMDADGAVFRLWLPVKH